MNLDGTITLQHIKLGHVTGCEQSKHLHDIDGFFVPIHKKLFTHMLGQLHV